MQYDHEFSCSHLLGLIINSKAFRYNQYGPWDVVGKKYSNNLFPSMVRELIYNRSLV